MANPSVRTRQNGCDITVNGRVVSTEARTLADLVAAEGFGEAKVATAVNGDFVPARARGATAIQDGDSVEILSARQGG